MVTSISLANVEKTGSHNTGSPQAHASPAAFCDPLPVAVSPQLEGEGTRGSGIPAAETRVLQVGPGRPLVVPSLAAKIAKDGDAVEIDAGTYDGDVAIWRQNNLTIRGVGGRAHLRAGGSHAEGKGIWVIKGRNTIIENLEFSGATVPEGNGAGIRQEGPGLTVRNSVFHHNENGILTSSNVMSDILIEDSEFAYNGAGDGQTHNLYIGRIKSFTIRHSYIHHAKVGHNVKTRAAENFILYNRVMDEEFGTSSYAVDVPNGGISYLIGNVVQKGPQSENSTIVSYGAEGLKHLTNELYVVNNTIVNDRQGGGIFVQVRGNPSVARLVNNIFAGRGTVLVGPGSAIHNLLTSSPVFMDRARFDYRIIPGSPAISAGIEPGTVNGFNLRPVSQYLHKARGEPRPLMAPIDLGAVAYDGPRPR
jgi:hypothetical protein